MLIFQGLLRIQLDKLLIVYFQSFQPRLCIFHGLAILCEELIDESILDFGADSNDTVLNGLVATDNAILDCLLTAYDLPGNLLVCFYQFGLCHSEFLLILPDLISSAPYY